MSVIANFCSFPFSYHNTIMAFHFETPFISPLPVFFFKYGWGIRRVCMWFIHIWTCKYYTHIQRTRYIVIMHMWLCFGCILWPYELNEKCSFNFNWNWSYRVGMYLWVYMHLCQCICGCALCQQYEGKRKRWTTKHTDNRDEQQLANVKRRALPHVARDKTWFSGPPLTKIGGTTTIFYVLSARGW